MPGLRRWHWAVYSECGLGGPRKAGDTAPQAAMYKSSGTCFLHSASISALLPGIAGSGVYLKIKNTIVEVDDTEKIPFRASSQGSAHQRP